MKKISDDMNRTRSKFENRGYDVIDWQYAYMDKNYPGKKHLKKITMRKWNPPLFAEFLSIDRDGKIIKP